MKRSILAMLAVTTLSFLTAPFVEAADPIKAALTAGGTHLANLQNADGGWFFIVGDTDCGAGPGVSCQNTFGVTGLGLVDTWRITKKSNVKTKALETGDALKARYSSAGCTPLPITADVTFLVALSGITGDASFKNQGATTFSCIVAAFPVAADRADNRIDRRITQGLDNLGAWDAALDIVAALEVPSKKPYALAELARVLSRQGDWDKDTIPNCIGCEILSKANLLRAMAPVKAATTQIKNKVAEYLSDVLDAQNIPGDGSWGGDTQITAYAVQALDLYRLYGNAATKAAVKAAIDAGSAALLGQQLGNGGFDDGFGNEVTEVNGEVLSALAAAH